MIYIFSYDVGSSSRRNRVSRVLERWGCRLQKSVFQCDISAEQSEFLKKEVLAYLKKEEDSLLVYSICAKDAQKAEGYGIVPKNPCTNENFLIL
jgi:CRISPR-associated protein Cas2